MTDFHALAIGCFIMAHAAYTQRAGLSGTMAAAYGVIVLIVGWATT